MIIFRKEFVVQWFTYGLIIIFVGAVWGQLIKFLALRQQVKLFKNLTEQSNSSEIFKKLDSQQ
jgi:hypothetical protein